MRKFNSYNSYKPYGSDDGYDYYKDNRDGSVDHEIEFMRQWRKEQAEKAKREQAPKSGD